MIRNIFFYLGFIPATALFSVIAILGALVAPGGRLAVWAGKTWGRIAIRLMGVTLETDLSKLPQGTAFIMMPNHSSNIDIPIIYALFPQLRPGFVAKESLFKIPLFGKAMSAAGHIPIVRENPRKALKAIDYAVERAAEGVTVILFPEGTRNTAPDQGLGEFKIGGMIMALKCGLPIVPLVIEGSAEVLPKGRITFKSGKKVVRVRALDPIMPDRYTIKQREQFKNDMFSLMNEAYMELRA